MLPFDLCHPALQSHNDWGVGEVIDRNYDWSKFTKESLYGMETPHDNRGTLVKGTMDWRNSTYVCACDRHMISM